MQTKIINVSALALKHNLPEWVVREEIEKTVSQTLSSWYGHKIEGIFTSTSPGKFELFCYGRKDGAFNVWTMQFESIGKNSLREISEILEINLKARRTIRDFEQAKGLTGSVMAALIRRISPTGDIYAEITSASGPGFVGVCAVSDQPKKERGRYRRGEILKFYVKKVFVTCFSTPSRLRIKLSRNNKRLVERLLVEELRRLDDYDTRVKCVLRFPGGFSRLETSGKIPRAVIKKVADEIKEGLIVSYARNK